ncbi:hypothetical protein UT300003_07480 [Clostridium sardiniense]
MGLILELIKANNNSIYFSNLNAKVKYILIEYNFINSNLHKNDINQNYIQYNTFNSNDFDSFKIYINKQFNEIENLEIVNDLKTVFHEIFVNVSMHSKVITSYKNDKQIFTSGYYTPSLKYVSFSLANKGVSFYDNIHNKIGKNFDNEGEYINWALRQGNSTRTDTRGGIGLFMLKEIIDSSYGTLSIISGKGYYGYHHNDKLNSHKLTITEMGNKFPGSVIMATIPLTNLAYKSTISEKINKFRNNNKKISLSAKDLLNI